MPDPPLVERAPALAADSGHEAVGMHLARKGAHSGLNSNRVCTVHLPPPYAAKVALPPEFLLLSPLQKRLAGHRNGELHLFDAKRMTGGIPRGEETEMSASIPITLSSRTRWVMPASTFPKELAKKLTPA